MKRFKAFLAVFTVVAATLIGLGAPASGHAGGQAERDKKNAEEKTKSVRGTIQLVDNDRVKIKPDGGGEAVVARVGGETKISVAGKEGVLTDLRPGQEVTCVYVTRERVNVCLALMARAAKK